MFFGWFEKRFFSEGRVLCSFWVVLAVLLRSFLRC